MLLKYAIRRKSKRTHWVHLRDYIRSQNKSFCDRDYAQVGRPNACLVRLKQILNDQTQSLWARGHNVSHLSDIRKASGALTRQSLYH